MKRRHRVLVVAGIAIVLLLIIGTLFFSWAEGWSIVDSLYFSSATITTLGYGDFVPTTDLSKIVTTIYSLISIPTAFIAFGIIAEKYLELRLSQMEKKMAEMLKKEDKIEKEIENNK